MSTNPTLGVEPWTFLLRGATSLNVIPSLTACSHMLHPFSELHYFFAQLIRSSCLSTVLQYLSALAPEQRAPYTHRISYQLASFSKKVLPFSLSFLLCSFWPALPANCLKLAPLSLVVLQRRACIHYLLVYVLKWRQGTDRRLRPYSHPG